jgi:hypothetical protein
LLLQDLLLRIFAKPTSTLAFLDVGKEPWVLSIPDMKGRYATEMHHVDEQVR